jgi:hypothetical protein
MTLKCFRFGRISDVGCSTDKVYANSLKSGKFQNPKHFFSQASWIWDTQLAFTVTKKMQNILGKPNKKCTYSI